MTLRVAPFEEIQHLRVRLARDRVSMHDSAKTRWFTWMPIGGATSAETGHSSLVMRTAQGMALGICGLLDLGQGWQRIKSVWIVPGSRRQGLGTLMTDELIRYCHDELGAQGIEVLAYNRKFYEARGFKAGLRPRRNGAVCMRLQ